MLTNISNSLICQYFICCCLFIACIVSPGCTKKKVETLYIPEYLKQYAVFQVGSYWVFRNENTGETDSSFISLSPYFFFYHSQDPSDPISQECDINYGSTFISGAGLTIYDYNIGFKSGSGGKCLKNKTFQPGSIVNDGPGHIYKEINVYDSLIINNVTYYNVLNTQYKYPTYKGDTALMIFYLVKSIGLIKYYQKLFNQDTTWSLLRYHVIQ